MASIFAPETLPSQGIANGFAPHRRSRWALSLVDPDHPVIPREALLAAAARAVLAALREPLEQRELSSPATAALRLLESALEPYFGPPK
jgi:hypothetical protein